MALIAIWKFTDWAFQARTVYTILALTDVINTYVICYIITNLCIKKKQLLFNYINKLLF